MRGAVRQHLRAAAFDAGVERSVPARGETGAARALAQRIGAGSRQAARVCGEADIAEAFEDRAEMRLHGGGPAVMRAALGGDGHRHGAIITHLDICRTGYIEVVVTTVASSSAGAT
jgi:hypothetical protein